MTDLETQLKNKRICRFCLNQDEKVLSNLYSRENRLKNIAPLPLQVMACVSIEVFTNDGMPSTVCEQCRMLMDHCYRFKQMCKKADTALRQFPLTGTWPNKLEHPEMPEELYAKSQQENKRNSSNIVIEIDETSQQEKNIENINKITTSTKQKILNKNPVKILNKDVGKPREPVLTKPVIKHSKDGTIELVTEIIDTENYHEIDPIKSAEPIETNVFPCTHCERSFPLRQLLDIHMVNHNRERNFQCESCEKKFFTKYDLGKHALIHQNEKPYKCVVCKKSFTRANLLLRHERIHTDIPKFLCLHCEKPFISKEELQKHTERHNKRRPYACKLCEKSFAFKQGLERHEVLHVREQPFPCQYCNLSFPTPSKLSRHLTAHAGSRPYPCKFCSKSFLLSHHLSRHLRSHREGSGALFKCYDCDETFTSRDNLIYHSAVHATQTLLCPICKEQFENIDAVTNHIKMHALGEQYACEFCDLIFMTPEKLDKHCTQEHVEEMYAYNEHDKTNSKKKNKRMTSQNMNESEILQEFVIEEFDDTIIKEEIVIEENNIDMKEESLSPTPAKKRRGRKKKNVENFEPITEDTNDRSYSFPNDIDFDDFTAEETALFEELLEEPPTKILKRDRDDSEQSLKQNFKQSQKQTSTPKMKQTTLSGIVNSLPKEISISKKEIKKSAKVIDETIIRKPDTEKEKFQSTSSKLKKILNKSDEGNKKNSEKSEMINIGNKKIQVKKIQVTKAQVELMAKQGKINFNKDGSMSIKQDSNKNKK